MVLQAVIQGLKQILLFHFTPLKTL